MDKFGNIILYDIAEVPDDGDIFYNPFFGDFWMVKDSMFVKINDSYKTDVDDPSGFVKVGHIDFGLINGEKKG